MIHLNKCENCINSRRVISENGAHTVCILPDKQAADCITDIKDRKVEVKHEF